MKKRIAILFLFSIPMTFSQGSYYDIALLNFEKAPITVTMPSSHLYILDSISQNRSTRKFKLAEPDSYLQISGSYSVISETRVVRSIYSSGKIINPEVGIINGEQFHVFTILVDNAKGAEGKRIFFGIGQPDPETNKVTIHELDNNNMPISTYLAHIADENEISNMYRRSNSQNKSINKNQANL